jgi:TP901 family phage tail tape measure protein
LASVTVRVNFKATGDFSQLQAQIRGLNGAYAGVARGNAGIAKASQAAGASAAGIQNSIIKTQGPLEVMLRTIEKNRMNFWNLMKTVRQSQAIINQHTQAQRAQYQVTQLANGAFKVQVTMINAKVSAMKRAILTMGIMNAAILAMGRNMIKTGKNIQWAGRQIMVGLGIPLLLLSAAANKAAEDYTREMTRIIKVTAFTADSTTAAFARQEESVKRQVRAITELGASMGFMASDTASAVAEFAQMGYVGRSLDMVSEAALTLSRVSGAELSTAIQLTRITAQAFGIELDQLSNTFARLNLIENNTSLSLAELAEALPTVASVADAVGLSIEQTSGFIAMMKEAGISANEGATALRTGLIRMVSEATDPAREAFRKIGIDLDALNEKVRESDGDIMIFFETLGDRINSLNDQAALNDFTAAIGKLTGVRQASRFIAFLKEIPAAQKAIEVGNEALKKATEEGKDYVTAMAEARAAQNEVLSGLADSAGARAFIGVWSETTIAAAQYQRELDAVNNSLAGVAQRIRAEINVELTKVGEKTLAMTNRFKESILQVLRWFNGLSDGAQKAILGFSAFGIILGASIMALGIFLNAAGNVIAFMARFLPKANLITAANRAEEASWHSLTAAINTNTASLGGRAAAVPAAVAGSTAIATGNKAAAGGVAARASSAWAATASSSLVVKTTAAAALMQRALVKIGVIVKSVGRVIESVLINRFLFLAPVILKIRGFLGLIATGISRIIGLLPFLARAFVVAARIIRLALISTGYGLILVVIGSIIIAVKDWQSVMKGFGKVGGDAIQRVKDIIDGLVWMVKDLFASVGGGADETATRAEKLGEILSKLANGVASVVAWLADFLWPLFEGILDISIKLFDGFAKFADGEWKEGFRSIGQAFMTLFKSIGLAILAGLRQPIVWALEAMSDWPVVGGWARDALAKLPPLASELAEQVAEARENTVGLRNQIDLTKKTVEDLNDEYEEAVRVRDELIEQNVISADYDLEALKTAMEITDEEYNQLVIAREMEGLAAQIQGKLNRQVEIEREITALNIAKATASMAYTRMYNRIIQGLEAEAATLQAEIQAALSSAAAAIASWKRPLRETVNITSDWNDELGEVNEELEKAIKAATDMLDALRNAVKEIMGDIKSALRNIISAQEKTISDFYKKISDLSRNYFDKFNDSISDVFSNMRDLIEEQYTLEKERIEEIQKSELDRLDAIEKEINRQEKMREKFFAAEKARIDFLSGKQISSLQIAEALAKGDVSQAAILRIQQEAAERQFVSNIVQREEENLRELQQEQRDAQRDAANEQAALAILDLEERKEASLEALRIAKEAYDLQTEAAEEAANAAIEAAIRAAEEAREEEEIRIQNYLREWERVTPATEEEYQRHLKKLERFLDQSGARLNDRINSINSDLQRQLSNISSGFQNENTAVLTELTNSLNASGFAAETALTQLQTFAANTFNQVINSSRLFTTEFSQGLVSSTNLYKDFLKNYQADMYKGFKAARDAAIAVLKEEKKWEDAGRAIQEALRAGAGGTGSGSDGGSGVDLPLLQSGSRGSAVSQLQQALNKASFISPKLAVDGAFGAATDAAVRRFQREYGLAVDGKVGSRTWGKLRELGWLHKGGMVGNAMASIASNKPLKSDEMMAVLQKGEYVIQKSAVRSIGSGILDKINTAKRSFSPMQMGSVSMRRPDPGSSSSSESNYYLSFHIDGGNIDEGALAKRVMFEIDKASRNSGGGRRVVSTQ